MKVLTGRVVQGRKLGRTIGFPTANLDIPPRSAPPRGVYRVLIDGTQFERRLGVCNVGFRPTVGGKALVVEVHIPGFAGNLYRRRLTVTFVEKLRAEKRFKSVGALRAQIARDVKRALASDKKKS